MDDKKIQILKKIMLEATGISIYVNKDGVIGEFGLDDEAIEYLKDRVEQDAND